MTALTAYRANFQGSTATDRNAQEETRAAGILERRFISRRQQNRPLKQRIIEEPHPEMLLNQMEKYKEKLRYKTPSLPATIEAVSEDDEELATTSDCSSSASSLDGRSPHVLPPEERFWHCLPASQAFYSHPLISPKFGRRSATSLSLRAATAGWQGGFFDCDIRRKRSLSSIGERLGGNGLDSSLPADFLNLPPIPETVPVRKISEQKSTKSIEEEEEEEEEAFMSECSDSCAS